MFSSRLTGNEEVPPLVTLATGYAFFQSDDTGGNNMNMTYAIYVNNTSRVTSANMHAGKMFENGYMVATLFKTVTPTGELKGKLAEGIITSTNLTGPLSAKSLSDLITLINRGGVYVNVYTEQNPTGEIRGQLSPTSPT